MNSFFKKTLYITNSTYGILQKSLGNKKVIPCELELVNVIKSETDLGKLQALYKICNLLNNSLSDKFEIITKVSDFLVAFDFRDKSSTQGSYYLVSDINTKALLLNNPKVFYAHYQVVRRNFENPNLEAIRLKTKNTAKLKEELLENSELITAFTASDVGLNREYIRKLVEKEFAKYNLKLKSYVKFYI